MSQNAKRLYILIENMIIYKIQETLLFYTFKSKLSSYQLQHCS